MGRGKTMVEFFSAAMVVRVCRYRSWRAAGDSVITMDASFRALDAFISPSAAITWGGKWVKLSSILKLNSKQEEQGIHRLISALGRYYSHCPAPC